jgi:hypothetical protein
VCWCSPGCELTYDHQETCLESQRPL